MYTGDPKLLPGEVRMMYFKHVEHTAYPTSPDPITRAYRFFNQNGLPTLFSSKQQAMLNKVLLQKDLDTIQQTSNPNDDNAVWVEFFTKVVVWNIEKFGAEMRKQNTYQTRREVKKRKNKNDMFRILRKTQAIIMDDLNEQQ